MVGWPSACIPDRRWGSEWIRRQRLKSYGSVDHMMVGMGVRWGFGKGWGLNRHWSPKNLNLVYFKVHYVWLNTLHFWGVQKAFNFVSCFPFEFPYSTCTIIRILSVKQYRKITASSKTFIFIFMLHLCGHHVCPENINSVDNTFIIKKAHKLAFHYRFWPWWSWRAQFQRRFVFKTYW